MSIDRWIGNSFGLDRWVDNFHPGEAARLIDESPTTIVIHRGKTVLDAQRVRIDRSGSPTQRETATAVVNSINYVVIGYRNYPDADDTDLRIGDRFYVDDLKETLTVIGLIPGLTDSIQAIATAQQQT